MDEPTTLQEFRVIVSPETDQGTRTVTVRQGRQTDAEGPFVLDRDQRGTAKVVVQAEERSDGASVQVATDLWATTKSLPDVEAPSRAELADGLFEALAAMADLRERIEYGDDPEQVVHDVLESYDLDEADDVFSRSDHERAGGADPDDWTVDDGGDA